MLEKVLKEKLEGTVDNVMNDDNIKRNTNPKKILYWRIGAALGFSAGVIYAISKKKGILGGLGVATISAIILGGIAYNFKK